MSIRRLGLVLGDQLSFDLPSLQALDPQQDAVLLAEVAAETDYVPHHPQKIALIFSAMRHFAEALRERGWRVHYVKLDDAQNSGSLPDELQRWATQLRASEVHISECGEWRLEDELKRSGVPITWHADSRFICSRDEFARWAEGRKQLRMEFFYREMRRKTGLLINGDGTPVGGARGLLRPVDWLRLGQLVANHGTWQGQTLIDTGYMDFMTAPSPASPEYGGMVWRQPSDMIPADLRARLPQDMVWFAGHMGQFMVVVPSRQLVVLRMGVAFDKDLARTQTMALAADLLAAL